MITHNFIQTAMRSIFATAALSALLMAAGVRDASATPMGPTYPPPGGNTFSATGTSIGDAGGVTFHLGGFDLSQSSSLLWGPASGTAVGIALDGAIDNMSFGGAANTENLTLSSIVGNVATWTGQTAMHYLSGSTIVVSLINTTFRLTVTDTSNAPVNLIDSTTAMLGFPGAFVDVTNDAPGGFNAQLEAFAGSNLVLNSWYNGYSHPNGLSQYCDTQGGSPTGNPPYCVQTSFQGGFFYDPPVPTPEPGTLALFGLGLAGLGYARRRKAL